MSNSYKPPDRSTYDPGWNDPPPMPTVASLAPAPGKPRTNLNKRVAFPMQSSGATSSSNVKTTAEGLPLPFSTAKYQPPSADMAPLPETTTVLSPPPPPTVTLNPSFPLPTTIPTTESANEVLNTEEARQLTNVVFNRLINAMTANTDAGKLNEIRKRLETLDQMWQENKLDETVQRKLYELVKALESNNSADAMEQHRLLVTQHINVSTQWATALRQIILSISPESDLVTQNAPAVLSDTEVVQFVDVSSKPVVTDSIPSLPLINPTPLPVQQNNDNTSNPSENPVQSTNDNTTKSKFGRFGRILHI